MRNIIRKITPSFLLNLYRKNKKNSINRKLIKAKKSGNTWSKNKLIEQLKKAGIQTGENIMVHSSMSKIGYLENGPRTIVEALLETIGENGNLLMPNSPNAGSQLEYAKNTNVFDVENDSSKLGAITEYFRMLPNSIRSWSPTEPVSCIGKDANYYTEEHHEEKSPYGQKSPFYKLTTQKGKTLLIGVTLDNAGTFLHLLEDQVESFKYPIYHKDLHEFTIITPKNERITKKYKVHDPSWSKKRKCDQLIPIFKNNGVLKEIKIGNANSLLFDASKTLELMKKLYAEKGITMYTPNGENISQ